MRRAFRWRVVIFAISIAVTYGSASRVLAQADPASQASPDLASRIDSLEKQLADLKSQMEAQKAAAAAPPAAATPVPAAAALPAAAPAAAPAPTGLAGLLGPTTSERICRRLLRLQLKPACEPDHARYETLISIPASLL